MFWTAVKRQLSLFLLLLFLTAPSLAQEVQVPQLTIVGTVHTGNRYMNHRHVYRKLRELSPDIIFIEQSNPFHKVFGLGIGTYLGFFQTPIEQLAEQKYNRKHPEVQLIPYDTSFDRRAFKKEMIHNEETIRYRLEVAFVNGKMNREDSVAYSTYQQLYRFVYSRFDSSLEIVNKQQIVDSSRLLMQWEDGFFKELVNRYLNDSTLVSWYHMEKEFWATRNRYMAARIKSVIQQQPGKRYVVLTGFLHRYFLEDELKTFLQSGTPNGHYHP